MTPEIAKQIAQLLNTRNQLALKYDAPRVLQSAANYHWEANESGKLIACAELKRVQWYQREICHLTVDPDFPRQGWGEKLARRCEEIAIGSGARLLQCTIREGNTASSGLFTKLGFEKTAVFFNADTGQNVGVWQKVISPSQ